MADSTTESALNHELKLNQLYLAIIMRYKDTIEQGEHKSLAELPALVTPKNEHVVKKADEIKGSLGMYIYNTAFYEASIDAFYFVKNNIDDASMPLQFWQTPEETLSFGIGDTIDKNILLASLLIALGNPSAKVIVHIRDNKRRILTYYEFERKAYALDFSTGFKRYDNREELIRSLGMDADSAAYEFNDSIYRDMA